MLSGLAVKFAVAFGGTAATYLVTKLGQYLGALATRSSQSTKLRFLEHVDDIIMAFVTDVAETTVKELKKASEDGKISKEEGEKIKALVVERVKSHFGLKTLQRLFGNSDLDLTLKAKVERAVALYKESSNFWKNR